MHDMEVLISINGLINNELNTPWHWVKVRYSDKTEETTEITERATDNVVLTGITGGDNCRSIEIAICSFALHVEIVAIEGERSMICHRVWQIARLVRSNRTTVCAVVTRPVHCPQQDIIRGLHISYAPFLVKLSIYLITLQLNLI